ncbi:DUF1419 domain-containing protein [Rhizobium sp. NFR03]|uniref:DUF1419 domain-containing protein n=1 Tax=Rhizobium sp. NFR03 TaxID=1566263 RepID=UPI0008BC7A5E|nr:DUF1419 domain-containing protein [Rhizobium sp. NFR03]SES41314.1 Protein of unknown function [Rhizobium sp. NFR03]
MQSPSSRSIKIFHGVATRHEMYRLFDRHAQDPDTERRRSGALHAGEWFEIGEDEHDHMFEILPPLWMRGDMFAMREFLTGDVTSVFFTFSIDGRIRWFHGYCDLSDRTSPDRMKSVIVERETRPVRAMTREERLEHIWSATHDDYRGYAGARWPEALRGTRTVLLYAGREGTFLKRLDDLTETEIAAKLPVQFRHLPDAVAA